MFATSTQQLPCEGLYSRLSPCRSPQYVGYAGRDRMAYVYPFSEYSPLARLEGFDAPVTALAFDPEQGAIAGGSDVGGLRMWDIATEQTIRVFGKGHTSTITDMEFHKTGQFIATVSSDKNLRIWDIRKSSGLQSYKNASAPLCAVQFSPNGKWVATGCARGVVRLYNLATAKPEATLELHTGAITSIHFHPELYFLAVGSGDGTISVWNLETFEHEFRSKCLSTPIDCVHFCGNRLVSASDHALHIYDMANLGNRNTEVIEAPWSMVGDLAHSTFADEVWFVEASGSTALTGKLPLNGLHKKNAQQQHMPVPTDALAAAVQQRHSSEGDNQTGHGMPGRNLTAAHSGFHARPGNGNSTGGQDNYVVEKTRTGSSTDNSADVSLTDMGRKVAANAPMLEPPPVNYASSELDIVEQLISGSSSTSSSLHRRHTHVRVIRSLWSKDPRAALQHLKRACTDGSESGALYDFLSVMQQQRMKERVAVDLFPDFLDVIKYGLYAVDDGLALVALRVLRSMNTKFRARVEEAQRRAARSRSNGPSDSPGCSSREALSKLGECAAIVLALADRRGAVGDEARLLITEMPPPVHRGGGERRAL